MTPEEIQNLPTLLSKDFKSIEPLLLTLNKHLTLRTYIEGYSLGETESKIWQTLRSNKAAVGSLRKGSLPNLTRWFLFIEANHPEIQDAIKATEAEARAKVAAASKMGASQNMSFPNVTGPVVCRFLPEPSGYLHIGHAKAALLNDHYAHSVYQGTLRLRLDDTNPEKESEEFQDSIVEDLAFMGIKPDHVTYTSDYFDHLYDTCKRMISEGNAYADDTPDETLKIERKALIKSRCRDRSVEENLRLFEEMKNATEIGKANCIRAKLAYDHKNGAMRDPVIYRCNDVDRHHRTGFAWKIYPTYDLACAAIDSLEGVTHALRSTEYTDRKEQYEWFQETLKVRKVYMGEFARMNFVRTLMSKRKLAKLVATGRVWGWDDPRMPTIRGIQRRGLTIPALREFMLKQGASRNITNMNWAALWATNKKMIDPVAPRHTAIVVKDAVEVTLTGAEAPASAYTELRDKHIKNPSVGKKQWAYSSKLILDQVDAKTFKQDEELTLMGWGNCIVRDLPADDVISKITCELNLKGDFRATEKKITWLSTEGAELVPVELWEFDYLLKEDKMDDDDLESALNPVTSTMEEALCDAGVGEYKKDDIIQLERRGYYRVDKGLNDWADGEKKRVVLFSIPTGKS